MQQQQQALDSDDILNVRWATEDPNPVAKERSDMDKKMRLVQAINEKEIDTKNLGFSYPADYKPDLPAGAAGPLPKPKPLPADTAPSSSASQQLQQQYSMDYYNYYYQYYNYYHQVPNPEAQAGPAGAAPAPASSSSAAPTPAPDTNNPSKRDVDYYNFLNTMKRKHIETAQTLHTESSIKAIESVYPNTDKQFEEQE